MIKVYFLVLSAMLFICTNAQIVSLSPSNVGPDDAVTITFDASEGIGQLQGANKVYMHHGVVTDAPNGTSWSYVKGNWGQDDGVGEMTQVAGQPDKWQIEILPDIRSYFAVPAGENIFRISAVFRSADGSTKGTTAPGTYAWGEVTSNLDFYIDLNVGNFISINNPIGNHEFIELGESINISATTSSAATNLKLSIDEGSGFVEYANQANGSSISYAFSPNNSMSFDIKVEGMIGNDTLEVFKNYAVTVLQTTQTAALPSNIKVGINYDETDLTKATLVLEAPGKERAYAVGDFNNWMPFDQHQMFKTPDDNYFWVELTGLIPQQEYVFQYWVDENIKIGDPYATKTADPWNDASIEDFVYPDLPEYTQTQNGFAAVLQTGQTEFVWDASELTWQKPDVDHLVIYELLLRDFIGSHSWQELEDTLDYLVNIGVDALEIMPFNEFEGNDSWGYNPAYYFAPDKYYGSADDLKQFIQTAHQKGLAIIMDIVFNHAYGQNPMLKLYFDAVANKPSNDNPWFNREYVGPFQWGYDWNHESDRTKAFMDSVNKYWIEEFHIDGYRFDFTKGMTNYAPGGNIDNYDQSRIDILQRMADVIWDADPESYIILEHWGPFNEESELANYGMKLWRNRSYDYVPMMNGNITGNFNSMEVTSHVSYFNSHDEQRIAWHGLNEGISNGSYTAKDPVIMFERAKLMVPFAFLYPGPKMMWQFDELGYDIDINLGGRLGRKPFPWGTDNLGYYEDPLRRHIKTVYEEVLKIRKMITPQALQTANTNHQNFGAVRRLVYEVPNNFDLVVLGNFDLTEQSQDPAFTHNGWWYDYFSGDSINISNVNDNIELAAGEWHIYTDQKISNGFPEVVEIYDNPVTISPFPFAAEDEITITFDAAKAWKNGTAGLVGANKVYFHSGLVLNHPDSLNLQNVVGTFLDDGIGEMTSIGNEKWEITITPEDYYSITNGDDVYKLGMHFRNEDNINEGYGFRNSVIYYNIESTLPFVTIDPPVFDINDPITITFNARKGNQELVGANKIYLHSSIGIIETNAPQNNAWNFATGNWGMDDGVGLMTKVSGESDLWEITVTPKSYYNLPDDATAFWLAAVFRSPDGSVKGTGQPGPLENGFIHTNQDFFIQTGNITSTDNFAEEFKIQLFPNPSADFVNVNVNSKAEIKSFQLIDSFGKILKTEFVNNQNNISGILNISNLPKGIYFIKINAENNEIVRKVVKI